MTDFSVFCVIFLFDLVNKAWSLENGLARTPPMGWMSWGYYKCNVDCVANPSRCLDWCFPCGPIFTYSGSDDGILETEGNPQNLQESSSRVSSTAGQRPPPRISTTTGPALPASNGFPRPSLGRQSTVWEAYLRYVFRCEVATRELYYPNGRLSYVQTARKKSEALIMRVADTMYNEGYQEAGYEYIIIDDCWSEKERDENGRLVPDRARFPRGMKFLADYIHAKGLKFGMYLNIAEVTCMLYPGSKGHFREDAKMLADWDVDYVKVDGCFNTEEYLNVAYINLGRELANTKRKMVYSCSWPYYIQFIHNKKPNFTETMKYCNLWRNFHDVDVPGDWEQVKRIIRFFRDSFYQISKYHGPGHWNDPDMLIISTGALTISQSRIQMAVYAMMSSPLIMSCDMSKVRPDEKEILQNLDLIAIGQDPLGSMAKSYLVRRKLTLWVKRHTPMKGDLFPTFSFALVNFQEIYQTATIVPKDYGVHSDIGYTVLDVFTGDYFRNMTANESLEFTVSAEDVVLYTLYPL